MLMLQIAPMMSAGRTEVFGDVYSFTSGTLPSGATYTRAGSQLIVNSQQVYEEATANQAPFNYDLQTGTLTGLFMRDRTYTNRITHDNHNPPNITAAKWQAGEEPALQNTPNAAWGSNFTSVGSVFSQVGAINSDTADQTTTGAHAKGIIYLVIDQGDEAPQFKWGDGTAKEFMSGAGPTFLVDYSSPGSGKPLRISTFGAANLEYWGQFVIATSDTNLDIFDIPIGAGATVSAGSLVLDVADQTFPIGEVTLTTESNVSTNTQAITVTGGGGYTFDWADFTSSSGDHIRQVRFGEGTQNPPPDPDTKRDASGLWIYPGAPLNTTWSDAQLWEHLHNGSNVANPINDYVPIVAGRWYWDQIENVEDTFVYTDIDAFQTKAKTKGKKWAIIILAQRFGSNGKNPLTAGMPSYVRSDHNTYGGVSGSGGSYLEPGGLYVPIKWNANLITRALNLNKKILERYRDDTDFVGFIGWPGETATKKAGAVGPGYSVAAYETQLKRIIDGLVEESNSVVPILWLSFLNSSDVGNVLDYAYEKGCSIGSPDLVGDKSKYGVGSYYNVWEAAMAVGRCPDIYISFQKTYADIAANNANPSVDYSLQECWDVFDTDWTVGGYEYGKGIVALCDTWTTGYNIDDIIPDLEAIAPNFSDGDR